MQLMTKAIERKMPALYSSDGTEDRPIIVKYFTPDSNWTWYVIEGQRESSEVDCDWMFFGLVDGFEKEFGYFRLSELQGVKGPLGLYIERDMHFKGRLCDVYKWN